jgi:large subunit ribosomal protein L15
VKLHELRPDEGAKKSRRRVARGNSGRGGTYAGRGRKGQGARAGGGKAAYFEGGQLPFVRRLPFKRGFKNIFRVEYTPINLDLLEQFFEVGTDVTVDSLVAAGLIGNAAEPYKVLASGSLSKSLAVSAPRFSASAREAIESAGGSCHELPDEYRLPGMRRSKKR